MLLGAALGAAVGASVAECTALEELLGSDTVARDEFSACVARRTGATLRAQGVITGTGSETPTADDGRVYVAAFCRAFQCAVDSSRGEPEASSESSGGGADGRQLSPAPSAGMSPLALRFESDDAVGESCDPSPLRTQSRLALAATDAQALSQPRAQDLPAMAVQALALVGAGVHNLQATLQEANQLRRERLDAESRHQHLEAVGVAVRSLRSALSDSLAFAFVVTCYRLLRRAWHTPRWHTRMQSCIAEDTAGPLIQPGGSLRTAPPFGMFTLYAWVLPAPLRHVACMGYVALGALQSYLLLFCVLATCIGPLVLRLPKAGGAPLSVTHMLCAAYMAYVGGWAVIHGLGGAPSVWYGGCLPLAVAHIWAQIDTATVHALLHTWPRWRKWTLWLWASVAWPWLAVEGAFV